MKLKNGKMNWTKRLKIWKKKKYIHDFQQFKTTRSFVDSIYTGKISIDEAEMDQTNLLETMVKFKNKCMPRLMEDNDKKGNTFDNVNNLFLRSRVKS